MGTNVFIRQPFTESADIEQDIIQGVMDILKNMPENMDLNFLMALEAQNAESFKTNFEREHNKPFTPKNFREHRLELLQQANAFINIRVGMSESSAFELSYNVFKGNNAPIFFAIWENAPIKTTLLRELDDINDVTYITFSDPSELIEPLTQYFNKVTANK